MHIEPATNQGISRHLQQTTSWANRRHIAIAKFITKTVRLYGESAAKVSHKTHLRIKAFLSGVFTHALRQVR